MSVIVYTAGSLGIAYVYVYRHSVYTVPRYSTLLCTVQADNPYCPELIVIFAKLGSFDSIASDS